LDEFPVGHGAPEEIGKPRGDFVVGRDDFFVGHRVIEKLWRDQDHGQGFPYGRLK